ncbi:MAG: hypothetical protein JXA37_09335 [Chloroflexia bacterium]|nr:hypothetical protein [Chloroflexia bacterium]
MSEADVRAIRKARGFSAEQAATRTLLETFFLSDIGLEAALAVLSLQEIALLHLLNFHGGSESLPIFARIYGAEKRSYYARTFTQRYKETCKQVRYALVRRGVLLMAQDHQDMRAETKMERWRFAFPREFAPFLPSPFQSVAKFEREGDLQVRAFQQMLREFIQRGSGEPKRGNPLRLVKGELRLGERAFSVEALREWQWERWRAKVPPPRRPAAAIRRGDSPDPVTAIVYLLSCLGECEWVLPEELTLPLRVFCDAELDVQAACVAGWRWGCLECLGVDGQVYYRLPAAEGAVVGSTVEDFSAYLEASPDRRLVIDVERVPYHVLEQIGAISDLEVSDNALLASPNLVRLGRSFESLRGRSLLAWLADHASPFAESLQIAEKRWGKLILHENLLLARVSDLALRVQLEQAFPGQIVILSDDYVAFPCALLEAVEKAVDKWGYVIKTA